MSDHERMKDEVVLLALGLTPDLPTSAVEEHATGCDECRALMQDVLEVAGRLSEALHADHPPARLRAEIMRLAATESGSNVQHTDGAGAARFDGRSARRPVVRAVGQPRSRRFLSVAVAALVIVTFGLSLVGNVLLLWRTDRQEQALLSMRAHYESELVWLHSAEYLLVRGEAPAYSTALEAVGAVGHEGGDRLGGRAVVYITAQARLYLLVRAEGLRDNSAFSVWRRDGDPIHLGDFMSTQTGVGSYVYAADISEWEPIARQPTIIEVREGGEHAPFLGEPILMGALRADADPATSTIDSW